jgi:rhodanese-related sulfurtransferase
MCLKKLSVLSLMLGLALAITFGYATTTLAADAAKTKADTSWKFHDIVDVDFVMEQIKVPMPQDVMIIDARPRRAKYDKGHIPMAVSIPDSKFDKMTDQLPKDKNALLIFYCGGFKCKLSHKSAKKAIALGYTKVKVFAAGYPAWKAAYGESAASLAKANDAKLKAGKEEGSIDTETFKKVVKTNPESIYLIDVRDPDEFASGSFKTAVNMPVDTLEEKIKTLPTDRPIVFVCGTGARSGESYYMVQDIRPEMKNVFYLEGELTFNKDGSFKISEPAS